jgi:hypothetical protein
MDHGAAGESDMRKMILVLLMISSIGCANTRFVVFGVDVTNMKGKDAGAMVAGGLTSVATHIAGHYIMAEMVGMEIRQEGFKELYEGDYNSSDERWVDRGGFLFQVAVNGVLIWVTEDSYFTKGYTATTVLELATYPIRHPDDGDFHR